MKFNFFLAFALTLISLVGIVPAQESANLLSGGQINFSFAPVEVFPPLEAATVYFQPDGKILSIGRFENGLSGRQNRLYRYFSDGRRDVSFNAPTDYRYDTCALQSDGKIVCSYRYYDAQNYEFFRLIRLNANGSVDTSFNYSAVTEGQISSIFILPDGQILIAGFIREKVEMPVSLSIAKVNPNGSLNNDFRVPLFGTRLMKIVAQSDGKVLAYFGFINILRRYNENGSLDTSFTENTEIGDFSLLANGKLIVSRITNFSATDILRLNSNGTIDSTFLSQQTLRPFTSFGVLSDGKILLNKTSLSGFSNISQFERLNENGAIIQSFTSYFAIGRINISPTNEIFITGTMLVNGKTRGIVKIHGNLTQTNRKAFDFDGDGRADFAVFRPSDGVWYILNSATNTFNFVRFGLASDKPVPADYDGDTKADIAVYRPSNGVWYRLRSSDGQFDAVPFGLATDIPTQGDYDGDGRDDISVFRPSNGVWYRLNSSGGFAAFQFGLAGDKPQPADYDGDGRADFSVYRPSDGIWYRALSVDNSYKSDEVGYYDGDLGTPADFDGDGRADLVYFKDFTGDWYGLRSMTGTGFYLEFGATGDKPVPADYDGDGKDNIAVWRPSTGVWWTINSANGAISAFQFGANGDIPIQSAYVR